MRLEGASMHVTQVHGGTDVDGGYRRGEGGYWDQFAPLWVTC